MIPSLSLDAPSNEVAREVLGSSLVILACFLSCLGVNLQKSAHTYNESLPADHRGSMYTNPRWWGGVVAMILASLMDLIALPLIPLSRVAALGSMTLVANVIVTPWFQRERLTKHDTFGCLVTVLGSSTACYYGATKQPPLTVGLLMSFITEPMFQKYALVLVVLVVAYLHVIDGFSQKEEEMRRKGLIGGDGQPEVLECIWAFENLDLVVGNADPARAAVRSQSPDTAVVRRHSVGPDQEAPAVAEEEEVEVILPNPVRPRCWSTLVTAWEPGFITRWGPQFYPTVVASLGGVLGGHSIMFAKSAMVLVGEVVTTQTASSVTLALALCSVCFTLMTVWGQVHFLNRALKVYRDTVFVLPMYQAFWVTSGMTSGLVFYQEYKRIPENEFMMFLVGVMGTLGGLAVLGLRRPPQKAAVRSDYAL
eukprot:TRINITY_DN27847_c0_g1_i1.p1 TRINITY_DN27847_c0_g1~~TRINITY_DN27847_c0_g1_i1.p1  ORF type:complete len:423 (+),score=143.84 TRINITY_DN27847_c0_g1_i1:68-1336(+)